MHKIYEALVKFFGKTPLGQLASATLVGAALALSGLSRDQQKPVAEDIGFWLLAGAAIGFAAGVVLLIPRVILGVTGAFIGVLGLFVTFAPMHFTDGSPVTWVHQSLKLAVGLGLTAGGTVLLIRMVRGRREDPEA